MDGKHHEEWGMEKWIDLPDTQKVGILMKQVIVAHPEKKHLHSGQSEPNGQDNIAFVFVFFAEQ